MLESLLNKVAGLKACNFIKKRLQDTWFPGKFAKILRTPFQKGSGTFFFYSIQAFTVAFPVFLSLDQNLMTLEKRSQHITSF